MSTSWLTKHNPYVVCSDIGEHLDLSPVDCAYALWSRITEPDDDVVTALVTHLGALESWQWLIETGFTSDGEAKSTLTLPGVLEDYAPRAQAMLKRRLHSWAPRIQSMDIRRELRTMKSLHGHVLTPTHHHWPRGLNELPNPPLCLWSRGHTQLLSGCQIQIPHVAPPHPSGAEGQCGKHSLVAIVGARACTRTGSAIAREISEYLAQHECIIISGGAFGIDADATDGALAHGPAIAVSAGGVDRYYPQAHRELFERLIDQGVYVSEVPPGSAPARHRFLSRNRLIAAMSRATIVVEAAWRSGALSTAAHARHLGRHVAAVPGNVYSPSSMGCHRLLREGAVCVTNGPEVLELLEPLTSSSDDDAFAEFAGLEPGDRTLSATLQRPHSDESRVWEALPVRRGAPLRSIAIAAGTSLDDTRRILTQLRQDDYATLNSGLWRKGARQPGKENSGEGDKQM